MRAKLAGTRQLYHVLTNQIPKPIPGVADMRPALETCGKCHWAGRDSGDVIKVKREYADDDANTETKTILQMFVGGPGRPTSSGRAIHWHADPDVRIEFVSTDHERQKIPYVRLVGKDGKVKEYKAEGATDEEIAKGERRVMDCIDCHNVPAHRIAPTAEQAVDAAIANGSISRDLPFVRRESVRLVKSDYSTQEQGLEEIEKGVRGFYTGKNGVDDASAGTNDCRGEERVSAECVSGDEGDVWRLSRQPRAHHVRRMRALSRRPCCLGRQHDQQRLRVLPQTDRAARWRQSLIVFPAFAATTLGACQRKVEAKRSARAPPLP